MAVKQKLCSRRGATLMAALLFFLVAAVCGSIILAAATATVSRMTTQAEDARAYYSLTSAAQLVRDDLLQSHWKVTVTQTKSGENIFYSYKIKALNADGDEDTKTFIQDMIIPEAENDKSVFNYENNMTITTTRGEGEGASTLPTVYAKPVDINFKKLFDDYQSGRNTQLVIRMTNDPNGLGSTEPLFQSSFTEGGKTRQAYWLELTFDSVKVPSGYTDKMKADGSEEQTFEIRWDNVSIRKLNYVPVQNTGTTP